MRNWKVNVNLTIDIFLLIRLDYRYRQFIECEQWWVTSLLTADGVTPSVDAWRRHRHCHFLSNFHSIRWIATTRFRIYFLCFRSLFSVLCGKLICSESTVYSLLEWVLRHRHRCLLALVASRDILSRNYLLANNFARCSIFAINCANYIVYNSQHCVLEIF